MPLGPLQSDASGLPSGKFRIIFMGTPAFALPTFQAVSETEEVIAVITQPDRPKGRKGRLTAPPVKLAAKKKGIPVYQPERLRKSDELIQTMTALAPDLIVVIAYGQILPERILNIPKRYCINVHTSLLPKYRGAAPIQWAIINGEKETGVTTMRMDAGMDTGPILRQKTIEIGVNETAASLSIRLAESGAALLLETLTKLKEGLLTPQAQESSLATMAPLLKKEDGIVRWASPAPSIYNYWRGLSPWPGSTTFYQKRRWKITSMQMGCLDEKRVGPGTVLKLSEEGLEVAAGIGTLFIKELQPEGKRPMTPREYSAGHPIKQGEILSSPKETE